MSRHGIEITVNGRAECVDTDSRRLLSELLRDDLQLTGTKRGCETGVCGACSVLVDGKVMKSCLLLAVQCAGRRIDSVEGLAQGDALHPLQESFMRCGGLQCGYCTPGFLMTACSMLAQTPRPTADEVRHGLNGNLCRCTGYGGIVEAILQASEQHHGT